MRKLVMLIFEEKGDLERVGFSVTLRLGDEGQTLPTQQTGSLPSNPELVESYNSWKETYDGCFIRVNGSRLEQPAKQITNFSIPEVEIKSENLRQQFNDWLQSQQLNNVRQELVALVANLQENDEVRLIIQTSNTQLQKLPWHLWDILRGCPKAEISVSPHNFSPRPSVRKRTSAKFANNQVNILAILGNDKEINVEEDRRILNSIPGAKVKFLVKPEQRDIDNELREKSWDILFFAGHSRTEGEKGIIYINSTESLTIGNLNYALEEAIRNGLQIAIFNSCDSLGLAKDLADLNLPHMIIMREQVPDKVAQEFLKYFLGFFSQGQSFYLAVKKAREKLQSLENQFPCASWLPVIYQKNPTKIPPTWKELRRIDKKSAFCLSALCLAEAAAAFLVSVSLVPSPVNTNHILILVLGGLIFAQSPPAIKGKNLLIIAVITLPIIFLWRSLQGGFGLEIVIGIAALAGLGVIAMALHNVRMISPFFRRIFIAFSRRFIPWISNALRFGVRLQVLVLLSLGIAMLDSNPPFNLHFSLGDKPLFYNGTDVTAKKLLDTGVFVYNGTDVTAKKLLGIWEFALLGNGLGHYECARDAFDNYLKQNPNDPEALIYKNNAIARLSGRPPLRIAVSVPIGSNPDVAAEILRGVAQAQAQINNDANGINGAKLEIKLADDRNNRALAASIAHTFVHDPQVLAVIGHNASNASQAAAPIYNRNHLVMITPTSFASAVTNSDWPYIFQTTPTAEKYTKRLVNYIVKTDNIKKAVFCFDSNAQDNNDFKKALSKSLIELANTSECDVRSQSFNADDAIQEANDRNAQALIVNPFIDEIDKTAKLFNANTNNDPPLHLYGSSTFNTFKTLSMGAAIENLVIPVAWYPDFYTKTKFVEEATNLWGTSSINWRTAMSYDAAEAIITALLQIPSRSDIKDIRSDIKETLLKKDFSVEGAEGTARPVKFDSKGGRSCDLPILLLQVKQKDPSNPKTEYGFVRLDVPDPEDKSTVECDKN